MRERMRAVLEFVQLVAQGFRTDRCAQVAASLAFTTLLSLVPLLTVALVTISSLPVFTKLAGALRAFLLANLLPERAGDMIARYALQFSQKASQLSLIGSLVLLVTAMMLMLTIDRSFNEIWRVRRPRPLARRVLVYGLALTLGPVVLGAALATSTYFLSASLGLVQEARWVRATLFRVLSLGSVMLLLSALYYAVPNRGVAFRDALAGGIVASLGLVLIQRLFSVYVAMFPTYALIYGTFATLPIFLVWLYLSWCVVLVGALVSALLPEFRAGIHAAARYPGRSFYACLRILQLLAEARGQARSLQQLSEAAELSLAETESLLEEMAAAHWTVHAGRHGWWLGRGVEDLKLSDVFARFAFSPLALPAAANARDARLREWLLRAYENASAELSLPLSELFQIG